MLSVRVVFVYVCVIQAFYVFLTTCLYGLLSTYQKARYVIILTAFVSQTLTKHNNFSCHAPYLIATIKQFALYVMYTTNYLITILFAPDSLTCNLARQSTNLHL